MGSLRRQTGKVCLQSWDLQVIENKWVVIPHTDASYNAIFRSACPVRSRYAAQVGSFTSAISFQSGPGLFGGSTSRIYCGSLMSERRPCPSLPSRAAIWL